MDPIKIFYSYSQVDEKYRDELEKSLIMLQRSENLAQWHFRKILPGQDLDSEISEEIEKADIILLLVSRDFLASNYCYDIEVKRAMELHKSASTIVIPIILRECDWLASNCPFRSLEALPKNGQPISQWNDVDSAFNDITKRLRDTINNLKELKKNDALKKEKLFTPIDLHKETVDEIQEIEKALKLIKQQFDKLSYNSSKEDFDEVQNYRNKLFDEFVGKIDEKIENIPALKNKIIYSLFDKIYALQKLDSLTIQDIQNLRTKKQLYQYFERKVIINSLTLSLLTSAVFDPNKVNLLIDFLTDFEEGVWESALIGIVISLVYHQNKWIRFNDLKNRLRSLQDVTKVQTGIAAMEVIFRNQLYAKSRFDKDMYQLPFFETPINCFIPFYKDNLILENAIQNNTSSEIDVEHFVSYVNNLPFLDCYKYALCLSLEKGQLEKRNASNGESIMLNEYFTLSSNFEPYQNLICEYYNFLTYYPARIINNVFTNQFSITRTKLKDLILNKVNEFELSADVLADEGQFKEAINKLSQILLIEPNHISANAKIASCYANLKRPDYSSAISHYKKIENIGKKDLSVITNIAKCYIKLRKFDEAFVYVNRALAEFPNSKSTILIECNYYDKVKDFNNAVKSANRGCELYPFEHLFPLNVAEAYSDLELYESAMPFFLKAAELSTDDSKSDTYEAVSGNYLFLKEFDKAIEYAHKAYELNNKNTDAILTMGRTYLLTGQDNVIARKYLELAISKANKIFQFVLFGNLGHLEFIERRPEKAFEFYKKCIVGLNDEDDFSIRFDKDFELMQQLGVNKQAYIDMKNQVLNYFRNLRN